MACHKRGKVIEYSRVVLRETEKVAQAEGNTKMNLYALVEEWPHESLVSFRELPG